MFDIKHVIIDDKRWELRTKDGQHWQLHTNYAKGVLKIPAAHCLKYWCRKGVMYGEVKKKG